MPDHPEVTGRDDFLIAQALHEAIKALAALPEEHRPGRAIADMRRLLLERYPGAAEHFAAHDELRAGLIGRRER